MSDLVHVFTGAESLAINMVRALVLDNLKNEDGENSGESISKLFEFTHHNVRELY